MTDSSSPDNSVSRTSALTVADVVKELVAENHAAVTALFEGMSEPKRSAFRKEFLEYFILYGTDSTNPLSKSQQHDDRLAKFQTARRHFPGTLLINLAVGNRDEVLNAIRPAVAQLTEFVVPIVRERDLSKFMPAVSKHLLANRSDSLPTWSLLVDAGLIPMTWDDRTVMMICDSESPSEFAFLHELVARSPHWNELIYYMCGVENWLVIACRPALDLIDNLMKRGQLDRMRMLRSALSGMLLVKNQNQSKACEMIFDFVAPNGDELVDCQADLCSVMNHCKPVMLNFCFEKLEKLAAEGRIDWTLVCPSIGAAFSRAGLAQANHAIRILQSGLEPSAPLDCVCQALAQALLHGKREIAERAWKALEPALKHASESVLYEVEQAGQLSAGMLGKTIVDSIAQLRSGTASDVASAEVQPVLTSAHTNTPDHSWDAFVEKLQSIPVSVRKVLRCKQAFESAYRATLADSHDWGLANAWVLPTAERLPPIETMDELVLRIGRVGHSSESGFEEPELILDGICRLPRASDPQFQSKTAALRKDALSSSPNGLSNRFAFPDYAVVMLGWLGESTPTQVDRYIRRQFDEVAHTVVAATVDWVREGRSFQLTSTPTHRGGWLDPEVWLDRLEEVERSGEELLLADVELALLRLAPDGRTTPIRNASLLERAKRLTGAHAPMVRYAMGESIAWETMTGSKRLWIAAIRGRNPYQSIPDSATFSNQVKNATVLEPADWQIEFRNEIGDAMHPKGCSVALKNGDLSDWSASAKELVQLDKPFRAGLEQPDNVYLTRYLMRQALHRHEWTQYRCSFPQQFDWYWIGLLKNLIFRSTRKDDVLFTDTSSPWLESERPLTEQSAWALWLATLTKGDVSKVWIQEVWSQLIQQDRMNTPLLVRAAAQLAPYSWCVIKRWAEILASVARRSDLHAWEVARLAMRLLCTIDIDQKDALGLLETIQDAHAKLGLGTTNEERSILSRYDSGKCKKAVASILAIDDEMKPERVEAAREKLLIRMQRAQAWAEAVPESKRLPETLDEEEIASERIDVTTIELASSQSHAKSRSETADSAAKPTEAMVPTANATASKAKRSAAKKKSIRTDSHVLLERSGPAMRLFRASIPGLAAYSRFDYYLGWACEYLDCEASRFDREDRYLMFLLHHLGLPVVRSPWELARQLQEDAQECLGPNKEFSPTTWLTSLATSLVTGNVAWASTLLGALDFNKSSGYDDVPSTALALVVESTRTMQATPIETPNSLKLQLEKDKKFGHWVELCGHLARRDSAAFAKSFESSAKKVAGEIGKILKSNEDWRVRWWPSALLCVMWHAARHAGLDCSQISTKTMALVPTAATIEPPTAKMELITRELPENRNQLALELLDRMMSKAGLRYALLRPRVNEKLIAPHTTDWSIIVDTREEQTWQNLFDSYDPAECLLNADLQIPTPGDYQVNFAVIARHGSIFRHLTVPEELLTAVLEKAERREFFGTQVSLAPLEESIGLLTPLLNVLANDVRLSQGKAQNRAYYRAQVDDVVKWIVGLLKSESNEIIWPRIEAVARKLNASPAVAMLKTFV